MQLKNERCIILFYTLHKTLHNEISENKILMIKGFIKCYNIKQIVFAG